MNGDGTAEAYGQAARVGGTMGAVSTANREAVRQLHDPVESGRLRRDLLFGMLDENVAWEAIGSPDLLPWAGTHRGHEAVRRWFEVLNDAMDYERFELLELYADDETVVEVIAAAGKAHASGTRFASEIVRIWTFQEGKVVRVRSYYDTQN